MKTYLAILLVLLAGCADTRVTLHEDNDYFSPIANSDRDFTQGLRVTAETPDKSGSTAYYFGQNIYTPADDHTAAPLPNERPYAAYLYAGSDLHYRTTETELDTIGYTAGIVGPHAYGGQVQNGFHDIIGDKHALGWRNQLNDEPGLMVTAERQNAYPLSKDFDTVTTFGANLGNVFTQAFGGAILRAGYNLPDYFGSNDVIYPRVSKDSPLSVYGFIGPFARVVGRNIFLDGNTFEDSQSIPKKIVVGEARVGIGIEKGRYHFAYTLMMQTPEYEGQGVQFSFGEVNLSIGF